MKGLTLLLFATAAAAQATVYMIRHGEKPSSGNGLTPEGEERAQCLVNVFAANSSYNIGHIMAETPQSDGTQQRPYDTVLPLAESLGLPVDISCQRDNSSCVAEVVDSYAGPGNILICWEHGQLTDIAEAMGDANAPTYPSASFNWIWTDPYPYTTIVSITSEDCPGLDNTTMSMVTGLKRGRRGREFLGLRTA